MSCPSSDALEKRGKPPRWRSEGSSCCNYGYAGQGAPVLVSCNSSLDNFIQEYDDVYNRVFPGADHEIVPSGEMER